MNDILILADTRQQKDNHIIKYFDKNNIQWIRTGLPSADYMAIRWCQQNGFVKDYSILIDTKKDLLEVCNNLAHSTEHQRVVKEIETGKQLGCKEFIFLIGENNINSLEDIRNWKNKHTKVKGETLLKIINTFKEHHGCKFIIVPKNKMGETIIKILSESCNK